MFTSRLYIVAVILGCSSLAHAQGPSTKVDIFQSNRSAVVKIKAELKNKDGTPYDTKWGTGFFFYKSYILTAYHTFQPCGENETCDLDETAQITVWIVDTAHENSMQCNPVEGVIEGNKRSDLALFSVNCKPERILNILDTGVIPVSRKGQLLVIGWGEKQMPVPLRGECMQPSGTPGSGVPSKNAVLSIDNVAPGDSGAPLLNDNGDVIGVVTKSTGSTKAAAVPINLANNLIRLAMADDIKLLEETVKELKKTLLGIQQNIGVRPTLERINSRDSISPGSANKDNKSEVEVLAQFHKLFFDQYYPDVIHVKVTPKWKAGKLEGKTHTIDGTARTDANKSSLESCECIRIIPNLREQLIKKLNLEENITKDLVIEEAEIFVEWVLPPDGKKREHTFQEKVQ